jgi:Domain of unknown function (DUF4157)
MNRHFKKYHNQGKVQSAVSAVVQCKPAAAEQHKEKEAEHLADEVMRMPEKPLAHTKGNDDGVTGDAMANQTGTAAGSGSNMDSHTQSFMESRFGTGFSNIKIHTGNEAIQMSSELNAQAFTIGSDIYFNEGKYNPGTYSGKHLLAHELAHTIQQANAGSAAIQAKRELTDATDKEINQKCLAQIGVVIGKLEATVAKTTMPDDIQEAVKQLRSKYKEKKIKCCYLDGTDAGVTDLSTGDICMDAKLLEGTTDIFANIGEGTVLHEGIHSLHTKKYPVATARYGKLLKDKEEGKEIKVTAAELKDLKRLKAWTEYWAYRKMREYNNIKLSSGLDDETIHRETMKDSRLKADMNEALKLDPGFDPRKWKPAG